MLEPVLVNVPIDVVNGRLYGFLNHFWNFHPYLSFSWKPNDPNNQNGYDGYQKINP